MSGGNVFLHVFSSSCFKGNS